MNRRKFSATTLKIFKLARENLFPFPLDLSPWSGCMGTPHTVGCSRPHLISVHGLGPGTCSHTESGLHLISVHDQVECSAHAGYHRPHLSLLMWHSMCSMVYSRLCTLSFHGSGWALNTQWNVCSRAYLIFLLSVDLWIFRKEVICYYFKFLLMFQVGSESSFFSSDLGPGCTLHTRCSRPHLHNFLQCACQ